MKKNRKFKLASEKVRNSCWGSFYQLLRQLLWTAADTVSLNSCWKSGISCWTRLKQLLEQLGSQISWDQLQRQLGSTAWINYFSSWQLGSVAETAGASCWIISTWNGVTAKDLERWGLRIAAGQHSPNHQQNLNNTARLLFTLYKNINIWTVHTVYNPRYIHIYVSGVYICRRFINNFERFFTQGHVRKGP
jgi:hypothetical protein